MCWEPQHKKVPADNLWCASAHDRNKTQYLNKDWASSEGSGHGKHEQRKKRLVTKCNNSSSGKSSSTFNTNLISSTTQSSAPINELASTLPPLVKVLPIKHFIDVWHWKLNYSSFISMLSPCNVQNEHKKKASNHLDFRNRLSPSHCCWRGLCEERHPVVITTTVAT